MDLSSPHSSRINHGISAEKFIMPYGSGELPGFISMSYFNKAVVHIINTRSSKVLALMHLSQVLLKSAACFSFSFSTRHVSGAQNQMLMLFPTFVGRSSIAWPPMLTKNFWIS